MDTELRET